MLQQLIDVLFPAQCGGCGRLGSGLCESCLPRSVFLSFALRTLSVRTLGAYEGNLRRAVLALKSGRRDVAQAFAERLCMLVDHGECIVAVPTTAARRRERGFDGCELMGSLIARHVPVVYRGGLVQVKGDRQRGRAREARLAAYGRFAWRGPDLQGQRVTLLDDVVTTGATLEDCARTLRDVGATLNRAIAIARA